MADTILFAMQKEPAREIEVGEEIKRILRAVAVVKLQRTMPCEALRQVLAFCGRQHAWHDEQCSLAEFCAHIAVDLMAHVDLAAEARVKPPITTEQLDAESEEDESETERGTPKKNLELVDIGGGDTEDVIDDVEDTAYNEVSRFPVHDPKHIMGFAFQRADLQRMASKKRLSYSDKQLKQLDQTFAALLEQNFAKQNTGSNLWGMRWKEKYRDMMALQTCSIRLQRQQQGGADDLEMDDAGDSWLPPEALPPDADRVVEAVPLALALQGPAAVAWKLLSDASCTEEQIDAVALLALSLQKRFDARPDQTTHLLPVATATNNHRAVWLGGGGVGKTHTLTKVVEPLAVTYFGDSGYGAAAQANHAAQNLGPRGRTLHAANGLTMVSSLQTARLRLNAESQKKMMRAAGDLGVDVIDELGTVSGALLHADALRKTYGRSLRHDLNTTLYMKPQETWGRMPAKVLCGDFYQLPPVPASASLLADDEKQSYEHHQGRKLLADMEYVVDFVQMQRFNDPLQVEVLEAMRTPGGKAISEASWNAITQTCLENSKGQPAGSSHGASQPSPRDQRLEAARGWYECAYEWRIVSYAMHVNARLDAHAAGKILFYIPAVDTPEVHLAREDFDDMRAEPNVSRTAKMPGVLPAWEGMEMIFTDTLLPPRYVRGTACEVVGLEPHPREPPLEGRPSIAEEGCVVLHYQPLCIYVRVPGSTDVFLQAGPSGPGQSSAMDLTGVLAIKSQARAWSFTPRNSKTAVGISRTQVPLLPRRQCTLHGVQGKTADPGFVMHWTFPPNIGSVSKWLAYYVALSRPRSFGQLLSHGLPERALIESGPPEETVKAFQALFGEKIAETKLACAKAREEMHWPPRRSA